MHACIEDAYSQDTYPPALTRTLPRTDTIEPGGARARGYGTRRRGGSTRKDPRAAPSRHLSLLLSFCLSVRVFLSFCLSVFCLSLSLSVCLSVSQLPPPFAAEGYALYGGLSTPGVEVLRRCGVPLPTCTLCAAPALHEGRAQEQALDSERGAPGREI